MFEKLFVAHLRELTSPGSGAKGDPDQREDEGRDVGDGKAAVREEALHLWHGVWLEPTLHALCTGSAPHRKYIVEVTTICRSARCYAAAGVMLLPCSSWCHAVAMQQLMSRCCYPAAGVMLLPCSSCVMMLLCIKWFYAVAMQQLVSCYCYAVTATTLLLCSSYYDSVAT